MLTHVHRWLRHLTPRHIQLLNTHMHFTSLLHKLFETKNTYQPDMDCTQAIHF